MLCAVCALLNIVKMGAKAKNEHFFKMRPCCPSAVRVPQRRRRHRWQRSEPAIGIAKGSSPDSATVPGPPIDICFIWLFSLNSVDTCYSFILSYRTCHRRNANYYRGSDIIVQIIHRRYHGCFCGRREKQLGLEKTLPAVWRNMQSQARSHTKLVSPSLHAMDDTAGRGLSQ